MRIQHNIMAMSAYRNYTNNVSAMKKNLEKLSSGYKINRAGDDAAGLAISEKMRAQITGLETAQKNAKDGISLVQTAEGALTEVHDMLNRMVELATQSANGTYDNTTDRAQMQKEIEQLKSEIDRIADSSNFNGINLLDGTLGLNKKAFELTSVDAAEAGEVSGIVGAPTSATGAANKVTKLHTDSTNAVAGEFTVYLGQANVGAVSGAASQLKVKIGGQTIALSGTATGALTASDISGLLEKKAKYMAVKANGTISFLASTAAASAQAAAAGAKGLIYKATDNGDGTVTFNLKAYAKTATSAVDVTDTAAQLVAANVASGAFRDLNMDVAIAPVSNGGTLTVNAANVGTNATNSVMQKDGVLGSTELALDVTKLKEGMTIEINGVKKTVSLNKDNTTADINLSDYVGDDGIVKAADKNKAMNEIATAFKGAVTGVDVGVNGSGKLTLSENADATTATQKKMESVPGFQSMVKVTQGEVKAGSTIKVKDPSTLVEGDVLNITKSDGTVQKLIFTKKASNTGAEYVNFNGKDAKTLASDIAAKIGGTATGDTVKVDGAKALGRGLTLQIGDTSDDFNQLNVAVQDMHTADLGIGDLSIADEVSAQKAIQKIKDAINTVSDVRGTLGATQNRLDHTINNLSVMTENIQDAESTIRDVDVAEEMMAYTKNNILIQSAQAMLAQANQVPQGVLQLLG